MTPPWRDSSKAHATRTSLGEVTAWIDACAACLPGEAVSLAEAAGRVLARAVEAAVDLPPFDRAAVDGLALSAEETAGAGAYNPLSFRLAAAGEALRANGAALVGAGDPLPAGADAVVALEHVQRDAGGTAEIIDAVASGAGVERKASHVAKGATLLAAGRRLLTHDIGLLAAAGVLQVQVVRRPEVVCLVLARRPDRADAPGGGADADGPLLRALVERDGGRLAALHHIERDGAALAAAFRSAEAHLILVVGGTGQGPGDVAAAALARAGDLAFHGVALRPGETAGAGRTVAGVPVVLLPAAPAACLWAYEFLAGRLLRRLAGRPPALPFEARAMITARKIVSAIGTTEVCPVRCLADGRVEPAPSYAEAGIGAVATADGFVVVAEGSEGMPVGASVTVHLYGPRH